MDDATATAADTCSDIARKISLDLPLTAEEASIVADVSLPSLWRGVADGRLPAPVYPAPRAPRWYASEIRKALTATRALPAEAMASRRAARLAAAG